MLGMRERACSSAGARREQPSRCAPSSAAPAPAGHRVTPLPSASCSPRPRHVRRGLRLVLDAEPDLAVASRPPTASGARARLREDIHLAVLIRDARHDRSSGARELSRRAPSCARCCCRCTTASSTCSRRCGAPTLRAQADADHTLIDACRATMRGEPFLYPDAVTTLVRQRLEAGSRERDVLTPRETQVVKLIAEGTPAANRGEAGHQRAHRRAPSRADPRQARAAHRVALTRYAVRRGSSSPEPHVGDGPMVTRIRLRTLIGVHSVLIVDDHAAVRAG